MGDSTLSLLVPARDIAEADDQARRREYAARAKADGTWAVYDGHWRRFGAFAATRSRDAGPPVEPGLVADYVIFLREQGKASSTLKVALAAIAHRCRLAGAPSPTEHPQVAEVLAGAVRLAARAGAGRGAADPLLPADIRSFISELKAGIVGQRDMALLTFGLAGGFRREELCRLKLENLRFDADGILVTLPWSKTDQAGEGHVRRIARGDSAELCPVSNLQTWLAATGITEGPLFRPIYQGKVIARSLSPRRVDQIIREYTQRVMAAHPGALLGRRYSAHSLRSGLCTAAALAGKAEHEIRDHVGHKSAATTARYIRAARVRTSGVTKGIGL
jgi:integrase